MKKFLVIVSVAVVAFLLGTLVSMGLTANGIVSNPFDNQVSETSELQARIDSLNASLIELRERMEVKIIRFGVPDEVNITNVRRKLENATSFVWTPRNPRNNTILSIYCSFEFSCRNWTLGVSLRLITDIYINEFDSADCQTYSQFEPSAEGIYDWRQLCFQVREGTTPDEEPDLRPSWVRPNQETYAITFRTLAYCESYPVPQTYARNINVIMEVIDGK